MSFDDLTPPYATIVADPPWTYTFATRTTEVRGTGWLGVGAKDVSAHRHYETMTMAEIKAMPVGDLATPDAVLWLWVVNPMLRQCIDVAEAWGFSYRGILTWAKVNAQGQPSPGPGYWMRSATEHAVLAVRGKPERLKDIQPTWFAAPRTRHSAKPPEAYTIFEDFSPGPRLELFARSPRPGWTTWGDQSDGLQVEASPPPPDQGVLDFEGIA